MCLKVSRGGLGAGCARPGLDLGMQVVREAAVRGAEVAWQGSVPGLASTWACRLCGRPL